MSGEPPSPGVTEVPARVNSLFFTPPPESPPPESSLSYPAAVVVVIDDEGSTDVRAQNTKGSNATRVAGSTSAANVLGRRNPAQVTKTRDATSKANRSGPDDHDQLRQEFRDADEAEDHVSASDRAVKMAKLGVEKAAGSCNLLSISRARDAYLAAVHYQEQANQSASAGKDRADPTNKKSLVTFDAQRAQGKAGKVSRSDKKIKWKLEPNDENNKERSGISEEASCLVQGLYSAK